MPGRALVLAGAVLLLLCVVALPGCTQPVIPEPWPAQTTPAPVATTPAPVTTKATTTLATPKGTEYLTYTNAQNGFSISYPSGWTKQEGAGGSVAGFSSPSSGMGDIPASVKVLVEDLSANPMGLEQYKNAQLAKKQGLTKFNLIHDLPFKGTSYNGWKIGYTYEAGSLMETFEIYALRGTTAYTLTYTTKEDRFASFSQNLDTISKSFQLTG